MLLSVIVLAIASFSFSKGAYFAVKSLGENARKDSILGKKWSKSGIYISWNFVSLARALQESYLTSNPHSSTPVVPSSFDKDLQLAMELSVKEQEEREKRRHEEEDAELQQALQRSLLEK